MVGFYSPRTGWRRDCGPMVYYSDLPVAPRMGLDFPPPLADPTVRDADPVVRLHRFNLLVPQTDGDLGALVVDRFRIAHLSGGTAPTREISDRSLLANREINHVDLAFRTELLHFHSIRLREGPVSHKHFRPRKAGRMEKRGRVPSGNKGRSVGPIRGFPNSFEHRNKTYNGRARYRGVGFFESHQGCQRSGRTRADSPRSRQRREKRG